MHQVCMYGSMICTFVCTCRYILCWICTFVLDVYICVGIVSVSLSTSELTQTCLQIQSVVSNTRGVSTPCNRRTDRSPPCFPPSHGDAKDVQQMRAYFFLTAQQSKHPNSYDNTCRIPLNHSSHLFCFIAPGAVLRCVEAQKEGAMGQVRGYHPGAAQGRRFR